MKNGVITSGKTGRKSIHFFHGIINCFRRFIHRYSPSDDAFFTLSCVDVNLYE